MDLTSLHSSLAWLATMAVLFFWAVGAYNRLVRLRSAVVQAFVDLDEQLVRQLVWLQGSLPEAVREHPAGEVSSEPPDEALSAWWRLRAAADQFGAVLARARAQPIALEPIASLVMAHEAVRDAWATVLTAAVPRDAVPSPERLQERWMRLLHQAMPLRARHNEAVSAYNAAIRQFPASLIGWLFRFQPAGLASRLAEGKA